MPQFTIGPNTVVVVTGASAGVGRATVREFARHGARIGLLARGRERLEAAKAEVEGLGGQAVSLPTDVADPDQVESSAATVEEQLGPIDVWVNCAMSTVFSPVAEITADEFLRATQVTYLGGVYGTLAALKRMRPRDRGVIVQVGSALAYRAIPLQAPYCAAKHALRGFTDSLRCELMHDGSRIHVTSVHLPGLNTPQFEWCKSRLPRHPQPVPPIFEPEVAAQGIVWAAMHHRREVFVGFPTVKTVWGNKFAPAFADRYLARHGYRSQQTGQAVDPQRPSNLFEPVGDGYAAHGSFDDRAKSTSCHLWFTTHRKQCFALALGLLTVGGWLVARCKGPLRVTHSANAP